MKLNKKQLKSLIESLINEESSEMSNDIRYAINDARTGLFNLKRTLLKEKEFNSLVSEQMFSLIQEALEKINIIEKSFNINGHK